MKELFDFFKDTDDDELEVLEPKTIECHSIEEIVKLFNENPKENIRFALPSLAAIPSNSLSDLSELIEQLEKILPSITSDSIKTSYEEALNRVNLLKQVIENQDCYRLFDNPVNQQKAVFQYLFKMICKTSKWDINSEVNNGRGPVDFTISKGATDKTVIEFKLAKNSNLKSNLQYQIEIYKKANETTKAVIAILYFTDEEFDKLKRILKELELDGEENVVLIDG